MKHEATAAAIFLDYHMVSFLTSKDLEIQTSNKRSPCSILLITMGTRSDMSFSSCPHVDKGDGIQNTKYKVSSKI